MRSALSHIAHLPICPDCDGSAWAAADTPLPSSPAPLPSPPAPQSSPRDRTVNRLLDWSEDARRAGRHQRAEFLLSLAWEAYDR